MLVLSTEARASASTTAHVCATSCAYGDTYL